MRLTKFRTVVSEVRSFVGNPVSLKVVRRHFVIKKTRILRFSGFHFIYCRVKYLGYPAGLDLPENDTEHLHFPGIGDQAAGLLVARQVFPGIG